ncbi:helix-turn-helix domain-containing protein [Actinomycetospora rhizophila]|uniref:Helix-turn-helix domain-containing protein n=1 Tax=Actinomycetospora rhizophila TaxID=1416876 RepID=A0ABV9ZI59_9PSEU
MADEKATVVAALLSPEHRTATAAGDAGSVVRAARKALGWSQGELASRVGYSQATISRLERGSTRAAQDAVLLADVADALGVPPAVLGLATARAGPAGTNLDDVRRRDFLGGAAALTAAALLPQAIVSPAAVGQPEIDQAWRALERLFELDDLQGGAQVYQVADAMATKLGAALNQGRFTADVGRQLAGVAGTTMEHAGWLAFDAGQNAAARSWWLETIHLARDLGEAPTAHVAALASMSLQASGDPTRAREASTLADAARTAAGGEATPTLLSVLAAREAVAHAQRGDAVAAKAAMSESRRQLDHGPRADEPLWLQFWSPADLACHETRVALALGHPGIAETSARAALATADERRFPRNHAIYSARLGSVLARRGQLDEAISVTADAVKRIDQLSGSRRIVADLTTTVDHLGTRSYAPAQHFATAARRLLAAA